MSSRRCPGTAMLFARGRDASARTGSLGLRMERWVITMTEAGSLP